MASEQPNLEDLRQRVEAIESRAVEAEERARDAEQRVREAEQREQQLLAELAAANEAAGRRAEVRGQTTETGVDDAVEKPDFGDLAAEVEERVKAIEDRVARSNRAVQQLAAPGAPAPEVVPLSEVAPLPESPPAPETDSEPGPGTKLDVNRVSFEQLRELGLTVTQAARLLASRDARGRFRSLDELNELWGFSRDLIENLMRRFSVGS